MSMRLWFDLRLFGLSDYLVLGQNSCISRYSKSEAADTILETTASKQRQHMWVESPNI